MATIIGTSGVDRLGATGMTSGADRISASAGNDTLVYELSSAGGADAYYGGTGVDVLELRFTAAEWATHSTKVLAMQKLVADTAKPNAGAVAAGTNFGKLDFGSGKTVQVYEVESVKIYIDGVEYTGVTPPTNSAVSITSAAQAGTVVENGALTAAGTIAFTDADLADAHTVSVAPVAGALGSFVLGAVSESATTAAGSVGWTYNLNNSSAAVQALAQGQTVTETYTVSVSDGKGSTQSQAVTVTITGTNDAPVITSGVTAGDVVESGTAANGSPILGVATATGQLNSSDVDAGATATWSVSGDSAGTYGNFSITEQGKWTYLLDNAKADGLAQGAKDVETFTVRVTDDKGASVEKVITITVTGSEDAVIIATTDNGEVVEAGAGDAGIAVAQGRLAGQGVPAAAVWSIDETLSGGDYGSLAISESGVWTYTLDNELAATNALKQNDLKTEQFTVTATFINADGDEQTAERVISVLVNGTNDGAVISVDGDQDLSVTEAGGVDNAIDENGGASGTLVVTDPEEGESAFVATTVSGVYGDLSIGADGVWGYSLRNGDTNVQKLTAGQKVTDALTVSALDGTTHTITINILGADDSASITIVPDDAPDVENGFYADYAVKEAGGVKNATVGDANASGRFQLNADPETGSTAFKALSNAAPVLVGVEEDGLEGWDDINADGVVDNADLHLESVAGSSKGLYGDFALNTATGAWTYKLRDGDAAVQALKDGEEVTDKLVVYSADGGASNTITVTITGADDAATSIVQAAGASTQVVEHDVYVVSVDADGVETTADRFKDTASGDLTAVDPDGNPAAVFTAVKTKGTYGDFTLTDGADGEHAHWEYKLADAGTEGYKDIESLTSGETATEVMLVKAGGASYAVTVNVKGYNDKATFVETDKDVEIVEAGGVKNAINDNSLASGKITVSDADSLQSSWAASSFGVKTGTYGKFEFKLDKDPVTLKDIPASGSWTYKLNNDATVVQQLKAGEVKVETFDLVSKDGTKQTISINVNGANDEATISPVGTQDLSAKEDGGTNNKTVGDAKASGQFSVTDIDGTGDQNETGFSALKDAEGADTDTVSGVYGTFKFFSDTGKWEYQLDNNRAVTQQLNVGKDGVDTLLVFSRDGSASQAITVKITGANDNASVWVDTSVDTKTSVDAGGFKAWTKADGVVEQAEDGMAQGKLLAGDPDSEGGSTTFKVVAPKALQGTYGVFTFAEGTGEWTYTLTATDPDTKALIAGQKVQDKLSVAALDGSVYTISVDVNGANDKVALVSEGVMVNTVLDKLVYTVADGDKGTLSMMVGADAATAKVFSGATVLDGKESSLAMPAAAGTAVVSGLMFVSDNTKGHDLVELGTYLGLGTNSNNILTSTSDAGSLMAGYGGNDTMTGGAGNDYMNGGTGDDKLAGLAGDDKLVGDAGNDNLDGGEGNDKLDGGVGNDVLLGGDGNDTLTGAAGNDALTGGAGDDRLIGGLGKDVLTGGDGADVFVFLDKANDMGVANFDSIVGFESGSDSIELARSLLGTAYSATTSAGQAKFATGSWFKDTAAAIDADDRVIYDSKTGAVYFDADGSGSGARIQIAVLDGHPALLAADIHFV